jgi:hypothetical protein
MKKRVATITLLACAILLAVGILQLFLLRFEAGDVYPPYSSLRSDPLGTMALYESLAKIRGITARRDFSASNQLPEGRDVVYLHLAAESRQWTSMPEETFREIDQFLARGGRLVVALFPEPASSSFTRRNQAKDDDVKKKTSKPGSKPEKKSGGESKTGGDGDTNAPPSESKPRRFLRDGEDEEMFGTRLVKLSDRWGIEFDMKNLVADENSVYRPATVSNRTALPLPAQLDWHSGAIFKKIGPAWRTIYARDTHPVMIERSVGRGSVVIATDSYFLSNEAMQKDRHADLVAWLVGPRSTVYFDEAHFGVIESSGVSVLMRKYRLEWLVAGFVLLAGLFIWKSSVSLAPPLGIEVRQGFIAGKESSAGLVNLLRRSIAPDALLATCFAEWGKSVARTGKHSAERIRQAGEAFRAEESRPRHERNPLQLYRNISKILDTKQ